MSASDEVRAVIGRGGAELDAELHARARAELVGVDAQPEAGRAAGLQHRARLVGVERAPLAEHVDPAGVRRAGREHLAADERDVVVGAVGVRPPARRARRGTSTSSVNCAAIAQRALLVLDVEPVAGLDLDVRDPGPQRLVAGAPARARAAARRSPRASRRPSRGSRPPRTARRPSARRTRRRARRRTRGGCGCRRSPGSRSARRRRCARRRRRRPPDRRPRRRDHALAVEHERRVAASVPSSGSCVTSRPMLSIASVLTRRPSTSRSSARRRRSRRARRRARSSARRP